jgi:hypothetical protein
MLKKYSAKYGAIKYLPVIVIVWFVTLVLAIVYVQTTLSDDIASTKHATQNLQFSDSLTYNEIDSHAQQYSLTVLPKENLLYMPELKITVPLNPITRSIQYNLNQGVPGDNSGDIRISSSYMTDHSLHVQSCADMVRLKIEATPNAYSPDQPLYATVGLADGRKLNIYASTTKDCTVAWQAISPQQISDEIKKAQSYSL